MDYQHGLQLCSTNKQITVSDKMGANTRGECKMKLRILATCIIFFAGSFMSANAQKNIVPKPKFSLTIAESHGGGFGPGYHRLIVTETNLSQETINEGGCRPYAFQPGVVIEVLFNNVQLQMNENAEPVRKLKTLKENSEPCNGSLWSQKADPGKAFSNYIDPSVFFDMSNPGSYLITVTKETLPNDPVRSVKVRSNTITVIVHQPNITPDTQK
jgi:hypothetical protein